MSLPRHPDTRAPLQPRLAPVRLQVPRPLAARIERSARRQAPRECCGLLIGRLAGPGGDTPPGLPRGIGLLRPGQSAVLTRQVPSPNRAARPWRRFEIDPEVLAGALASVRDSRERVLGVYHSHPRGSALPSREDARGAWLSGWLWLIVAPRAPAGERWRAWLSVPRAGGFAAVADGSQPRPR